MALENTGPAALLTIGMVIGGMCIGLCMGLVYKAVMGSCGYRWLGGKKRRAESSLEEFSSKISLIEHKQRVLSVYTNEYFPTFQEAGWDDLQTLLDNLRVVETSLRVMVEQRQYAQVVEIGDYLLGRASEESARKVAQAYQELSSVENWREESRVVLLRLIQATTACAEKTVEVGTSRKRIRRKPTLLSLAELRDSMGDF
jgi:hypothetical protein